jgi:hypothetical protein
MNKDDIKRIVNRPEMISGIYNYCDRWCERCRFTSRCSKYSLGQEQFADVEKDMGNAAFWEKMTEIFEVTMEMILDDAEDLGIDLDDNDHEEHEVTEEKINTRLEKHLCSNLSKDYGLKVSQWFHENLDLLTRREEAIANNNRLGIEDDEPGESEDMIEIIRWYQHQIHVKIQRGLQGKFDVIAEDADFPKDSDGSIKVALIGIDRSIAAWGKMFSFFPEKEDEILDLLVQLEKLRRLTEGEFPEARAFIRVGFDD